MDKASIMFGTGEKSRDLLEDQVIFMGISYSRKEFEEKIKDLDGDEITRIQSIALHSVGVKIIRKTSNVGPSVDPEFVNSIDDNQSWEEECKTCDGSGETMTMVCYGGMPFEKKELCPDCNGSGMIETQKQFLEKDQECKQDNLIDSLIENYPISISWNNISPEYIYVAINEDGNIYAYKEKPDFQILDTSKGYYGDWGVGIEYKYIDCLRCDYPTWKNSLRKRPE